MECFKGNSNIKEQKYGEAVSKRSTGIQVKTTYLNLRYVN